MTLDSYGTTVELRGTWAEARPDILRLDQRTVSIVTGIGVSRPLLRTVTDSLKVTGGFEYSQQTAKFFQVSGESSPLSRDRIAALYLRFDGSTAKLDAAGGQVAGLAGSFEMRRGIDVFNASEANDNVPVSPGNPRLGTFGTSRSDGTSLAAVVRGSLEGFYKFGPVFEMSGKLNGQWANKALLNYDTYAIGNFTIGRGYDPGANTGDRAIGFVLEPRANFKIDEKLNGQVFGFYEGVNLWNIGPNATERDRYIASLGGGARFTLSQAIRFDVTYTHALNRPLLTGALSRRPKDRLLASMTIQFVPFGL